MQYWPFLFPVLRSDHGVKAHVDGQLLNFLLKETIYPMELTEKTLSKFFSKKDPLIVAAGATGDTWHLPPRCEAAGCS